MSASPENSRKIIHLDADCFYAAVEMRDNPSYVGQPLAVGGQADQRGVVAACNYEARAFGVRSAMPTWRAVRLCPQLIVIPPDFPRYRTASKAIFAIYRDYTELVEPLSLDEAFLDVSNSPHHQGSATRIAREIRARIKTELKLTVSAGVAPNKFLAKIASDWHKPDGLCVIRPHEVEGFVEHLPIEYLFGVGPRTTAKMHALNLKTCADLRRCELSFLSEQFGKLGARLYELCRGIDHRIVHNNRPRKSISVETTFLNDLQGMDECLPQLKALHDNLLERIKRSNASPLLHKAFIKLRLADFRVRSVEHNAINLEFEQFKTLLQIACSRHAEPIRLLGIGIRLREPEEMSQMDWLIDEASS